MEKMKKGSLFITTPIYYVNDKPHIGHAYTTVAADILARWPKQKGDEVFFLTGTDEHGAKVAESAKLANKSPQQLCDKNSKLFKEAFDNLNLSYDYFIRTTDQRHEKSVAKFMQKLYDQGDIYEGTYEGLYCTGCENFLTEKELVDGKCPDHLKEPEKISEKNYFFKLTKYLSKVQTLIEKDEIKILPEDKKKEALGLFKQGLEDFSVSRENVKWGIPLPFDKSQVTYVWVEALQNYISAIGYGDDRREFEKWWQNPLHIMAKDILKFHCIYWPALLLAAGEEPPKQMFLHGFFSINGQKMSKSIGNVIDPNDLVAKYGADATRYLLISQFPFGQDGDIKEENFKSQYNSELAHEIGNLVSRSTNLLEKNNDGIVPEVDGSLDFADIGISVASGENKLSDWLESIWKNYDSDMEKFKFDHVTFSIGHNLVSISNQIIEKLKLWELHKTDKKKWDKAMYNVLEFIYHMSWMIRPIMPETSDKIFKNIGIPKEGIKTLNGEVMKWGGLEPGIIVTKGK
ncbi:methionine--tRNA ligase, partial [Patescibacteria group bacterium]|nr:methionine--tRNA ligase [Patescibacteria group bacterium]